MVSITDYKNENGGIDWAAYRKAQVDVGDNCRTCGAYIPFGGVGLFGRREDHIQAPQECVSCQNIHKPAEVSHDSIIRCPACRFSWNPHNYEMYEVFNLAGDDTDVNCPECEHAFTVGVMVQVTFISPKLEGHKPEEEEVEV